MINIESHGEFNGTRITTAARQGGLNGLYRSAGFLMKAARQKIRYRRRKISSPGSPPHQHSKGRNSFRHTILFAVDRQNMTAYVGPQKVSGKVGVDVPRTLEFGGMTAAAANPTWYKTDGVPKNLNSESAIAAWLLKQGVGPLFMAGSESGVMNQVASSQKAKKYSRKDISAARAAKGDHWMFRHLLTRKIPREKGRAQKVYYYMLPIKTPRQAARAAKNIVRYYGYPQIKPHFIAPRPFMGPTLNESKNQFASFFAKTI